MEVNIQLCAPGTLPVVMQALYLFRDWVGLRANLDYTKTGEKSDFC
jgi:hypothetical protein